MGFPEHVPNPPPLPSEQVAWYLYPAGNIPKIFLKDDMKIDRTHSFCIQVFCFCFFFNVRYLLGKRQQAFVIYTPSVCVIVGGHHAAEWR